MTTLTRAQLNKAIRLIRKGDNEALTRLLSDVDDIPAELFYWAAWDHRQLDIVRVLLTAGANPDTACNADTAEPDKFARMSLRELATFLSEDADDELTDLLAEFDTAPTPGGDAHPFLTWPSTTSGDQTIYRRGGQLVVTGPTDGELGTPGTRDAEGLASALVDRTSRHGDDFVRAWNVTATGRMARGDNHAVLVVNFCPDEDEGYPGDDSPLTIALHIVDAQFTLSASKTEYDPQVAALANLAWPDRLDFTPVSVHHGE